MSRRAALAVASLGLIVASRTISAQSCAAKGHERWDVKTTAPTNQESARDSDSGPWNS